MKLRTSMSLRQGRKVPRTLYEQRGPEPADDDPIVGLVDTPELAALIVAAVNGSDAVPAVTCPETWTPEQVAEFEKAWAELHGAKHALRWLPPGLGSDIRMCEPIAPEPAAEAEPRPDLTFQGRIIIEWPDTQPGHHAIPSWRVTVYDAETGECINGSVSAVRIDVDPAGWITAELTQIISPDGEPVRDGVRDPVTGKAAPAVLWPDDGGRPRERTFRYLVSEMRVRQDFKPIPPEPAAEGVALEPRGHAYPVGGILSVGSEPVTP